MKSEWFETFFEGPAVEFWNRATTPEWTSADCDFLEKTFGLEKPGRLLDVPCGAGRHAIELARRGRRVTGVDLSQEFLNIAQTNARASGVEVEFQRGDMRSLDARDAAFDGAYCLGNSFGYLDRANAAAFLAAVARALKPGGKLVIETGVAAESILPNLLERRWHRFGDMFILSECRYDTALSAMNIDYLFQKDGGFETRATRSYVMTAAAHHEMLEAAGFSTVALNGGMAGEPYRPGSPRLVLTAVK